MSEAMHTPGPWESQGIEPTGDEQGSAFVVGANGQGLVGAAHALPTELDSGDFSRVRANALLIAAAPDLLEALKVFVERYTEMVNSGDCGFWDPEKDQEVVAARAAIAKATGGAS